MGHHRHPSPKERENMFLYVEAAPRGVPSPESALSASRAYATHPHLAGSTEDFEDAKTVLALFQQEFNIAAPSTPPIFSAGTPESRNSTLDLTALNGPRKPTAWIDTYYPVLNRPLNRSLEILGEDDQATWSADLNEDGDPLDEEANKYKDAVPTWHGLSKDGEAVGELVYVNYGAKEDYDYLDSIGVNLTGKIVIARYGALFRGLKIKGAEERGAAGVLIYSDPRDDGFVTVENGYTPYPHGPARNPTSVQRGSVQYLSMYPGDPTTPGYPSYPDVEREEGRNIPSIPSLPISWMNAQRLLQEIQGIYLNRNGTSDERLLSGRFSQSKIKLVNHVDTKVIPVWNAMAAIPGHIRDEVVIIGCHRDAWVMGAADPTSGTVSLREVVRGYGVLLQKGWRPLRTVVIASWDAEEYGLIGSTEWGEDFASWIQYHVVAYLNLDTSVSGSRFHVRGSPSLAHLIRSAAMDVPHPTQDGKSLWDATTDEGPFSSSNRTDPDSEFMRAYNQAENARRASKTGVPPLGSGSDYTVFLQRLGVASCEEGLGGTPSDAAYHYHSIYDSQRWQEVYADPGFHRHVAVAKHLGLLGLRVADSIVLPLNTTHYTLELDDYLDEVVKVAASVSINLDLCALRKSIHKLQKASLKLDKAKAKAEKRLRKLLKKKRHSVWTRYFHTVIDYIRGNSYDSFLSSEILDQDLLQQVYGLYLNTEETPYSDDFPRSFGKHKRHWRKIIKAVHRVRKVNQKLIAFERGFISEKGIKDREWYRHLGVAPGKWLGYGATTFPALTEALAVDKNAISAQYEADRLTELLNRLTQVIHP
ncbi:hypothetical protein AMATHDRAFT_3053 [Amanita thiersii Skay4041]|uniref:Zn-dependent exopeptidase n=1 Tax=Amanita thiersii Skay4041 TaxID=703135 RepID=A0A2A9NUQ4_9AGAR|nr:hypothetical protein AMATHDRAFT_3053 [Amanita thiersii Skay4041]